MTARPRDCRFRTGWLVLAAGLLTFLAPFVGAHTPDTSYCRIAIERDAVVTTFTFDLATLARITRLDADGDGRLTPAELTAAAPAVEAFLRRTVFLELNEREAAFGPSSSTSWPADAGASVTVSDFNQRLAAFTFHNETLHAPTDVALTFDFFGELGERHTVLGNFIWDGRENAVIFTRFEPDYLFDTGYRIPAWDQFVQYVRLGLSHIFLGYDHIAFLLALLFVRRFTDLLKIITAFTVAHTLTLVLAALQVVSLPARLVESAIAASIVYVAAENIWRHSENAHRWRLTFAFGLVHGFGFAAVLRELGLPADGLVRSLLGFNLGVELGQVGLAAVAWPLLRWIDPQLWAKKFRTVLSGLLLAFGAAWLLDRVFALHFMPF